MLASLARAYWSVATTPLKAVTTMTAIVTPQTQPPKTLTGTVRVRVLAQIAYVLKEIGGATITFTPICHPELAGEGIEYIWGKSKRSFRKQRSRMDMNKITQDEFVQLVDRSLLEVTKKSALAFARKARYFKLAYRVLSDKKAAVLDRAGAAGPPKLTSSYMEIEEAVKHIKNTTYKCHRGVSEVLVDGEE